MGQAISSCFGKPAYVVEALTPHQLSSLVTEACVPSPEGSTGPARRSQRKPPAARKPRTAIPNAQPMEGSKEGSASFLQLPTHSDQAPSLVASSSSRSYPDIGPTGAVDSPRLLPAVQYHILRPLTSTIQQVLPENFKFRILVVGKSSSGKSSLINAVFKVDVTATTERTLGESDINFEQSSEDNRYLIVHKCSQAVDLQNLQDIRDFILHRTDTSRSASERLHAIWICVPASDAIDGNLGEGVEEILRMGNVPIILVLTKFEAVVSDVHSKFFSGDAQQYELAITKAHQMCEDSCRRHFHKGLPEVPAEIVSGEPDFAYLVDKLVMTTDGFISGPRDPLAGFGVRIEGQPVSADCLVWSAALRVCRDIVVQASIEVGRSGYWHHLGSKVEFDDQTLKSCVDVIHVDLIEIWNFNDKAEYLSSYEFKAKMSHLVKDLARSHSPELGPESDDSYLSTEVGFADWVHSVYNGRRKDVRCPMGYIVNLMVILDAIFSTISDDISPENVRQLVKSHVTSGHKTEIHRDIREFVTAFADKFSVSQKDLILERIIDLIQKFCPPRRI